MSADDWIRDENTLKQRLRSEMYYTSIGLRKVAVRILEEILKETHCNNCNTDNREVVNEDEKTIYYHCSNCDMSDEEYKLNREAKR